MKYKRGSWTDRFPLSVQLNGGWIFVGVLCVLTGTAYVFGFVSSTSISHVLNPVGLHVWGATLLLAGILLIWSIWTSKLALQKLALNTLSITMLVYGGWLLSAVPIQRTGITLILIICLVGLAQLRAGVLRKLINSGAKSND